MTGFLLARLAARNFARHPGRNLSAGSALFLCAAITTVGKGAVSGMDLGFSRFVTDGFLGHVVVMPQDQKEDNVLFRAMGRSIALLPDEAGVESVLERDPGILGFVPVGKNPAMILGENGGNPSYVYLLGVDWRRYRQVFPGSLRLLEGSMSPGPGPFVLLSDGARKEALDMTGRWFHPRGVPVADSAIPGFARGRRSKLVVRDQMLLVGFSDNNSSTDVRVPVRAVFRYPALNRLWGYFAFVDIGSFRDCMGYADPAPGDVRLDSAHAALLSCGAPDDLFGGKPPSAAPADSWARPAGRAWNLVLVRLKPGQDDRSSARRIDSSLRASGVRARAVPWERGYGPIGALAMLERGLLLAFTTAILLVAAIVTMNVLSSSIAERVPEIGLMRSIGASRGFVAGMLLLESALLSVLSSGAGILVGAMLVAALRSAGIRIDNDFLQLACGGEAFSPFLRGSDIALEAAQMAAAALAAVLHPVHLATRIPPREAIARD